jgi:hypothetical protein
MVRARNFLLNWVSKNVQPDALEKGRAEAGRLADQLAAVAAKRGISKDSIEAVAEEPLHSFVYMAMEDAAALARLG